MDNVKKIWVRGIDEDLLAGEGSKKGKSRRLPLSVIRNIMMQSSEGGRGQCFFCHCWFSARYIRQVKIDSWHIESACKDCMRSRGLIEYRR